MPLIRDVLKEYIELVLKEYIELNDFAEGVAQIPIDELQASQKDELKKTTAFVSSAVSELV